MVFSRLASRDVDSEGRAIGDGTDADIPACGEPLQVQKAFVVGQVVDNGSGIPAEKMSDIFMPFYSTKKQASGIGLSFVKQILRLHNASIHVQSALEEGSTFSIRFPMAR